MPGAGKQPVEIQEQIKELLEAGFDPTTIHRKLKVGRSSIYRMKRCLQQHGTAYMPTAMNKKNGRPKVLTAEQELVCCCPTCSSGVCCFTCQFMC
jgi:transposase